MTDRYYSHRNAPQKPAPKPVKSLFDEAVELGKDIASPFVWIAGFIVTFGLIAAVPLFDAWTENLKQSALEKYYEKLEKEPK